MDKKLCILAVDDSAISLRHIEQKLGDEYDVVPVNSGMRALRYLKNDKPDLILLDINMAMKDGLETLKEIRKIEDCATIPVIMLTSKNDRETVLKSSQLGINDYVLKPFDSDDIHMRIKAALEKSGALSKKAAHTEKTSWEENGGNDIEGLDTWF